MHTFLHGVWRKGRIALRYYSRLTSSAYVRREREAELDRQDNLDALEEECDVAKARSAFYQ